MPSVEKNTTATHSRIGAAVLVVGSLLGVAATIIQPTVSEKAADQAAAAVAHSGALVTGAALNGVAVVMMAGGLVWLAWATYRASPWLAFIGGGLGVIGLFAVMVDTGSTSPAPRWRTGWSWRRPPNSWAASSPVATLQSG